MAVKQILEECDEVIIVIASAQFNYLLKDPFTAGERVEMIHNALKDADIDMARCYIIPIQNDENNARWFLHLRSYLPSFDVVYSGNTYVRMLLNNYVSVKEIRFYDKSKYNGTIIRELMIKDGEWRELVPKPVYDYMIKIDGVNRLKIIATAESRPQEW